MMQRLLIATTLLLCAANVAEAKTWSGKWDGQTASTLTFLANKQVRYCFKSKCVVRPYTGDPSRFIRFRWGQASFSFKRTGSGYSGRYRAGSSSSTINLK